MEQRELVVVTGLAFCGHDDCEYPADVAMALDESGYPIEGRCEIHAHEVAQ